MWAWLTNQLVSASSLILVNLFLVKAVFVLCDCLKSDVCILFTAASGGWQEPENPHTQRVGFFSTLWPSKFFSSCSHVS